MRASFLLIFVQSLLVIACVVLLFRTKAENKAVNAMIKNYSYQMGVMQAREDFLRGRFQLYEVKLFKETDGIGFSLTDGITESTGKQDGPFQIRYMC